MIKPVTRRESLLTALFGTGYIGLRALATGLPTWFLLNPRRASAQDMQCFLDAKNNYQYLVISTSSMGDPINCNVPGTYENTAIVHPNADTEVGPTTVQLGSKTYGAALPWADPSVMGTGSSTTLGKVPTGQLSSSVLARTCFFHHLTGTTVHGDQPKVMKILGATANGEMMVSAFAKHLSTCFATVQPEPIAVGAGTNASELISYSGRTLPAITPMQLKQLLSGSNSDPLVAMRQYRDTALDSLNALAKQDGTGTQQAFIDALATSQTQVRALSTQLSSTLSSISGNDATGQGLAAAALIAANVTPVVSMHIPFGGDNHEDNNLKSESDQLYTGVAAIQALITALTGLGLQDKVTFATLNVFGRNLNNIQKVTDRTGRDHFGNHHVTIMIGKNVAPSVIGGVTTIDTSGTLAASDIDSTSGQAVTGGDIPAAQTNVAAARTLGAALGIPDSVQMPDWISSAGGKTVPAALVAVPT